MSQPELIAQLREARPAAPPELRERVRLVAAEAPPPRRRRHLAPRGPRARTGGARRRARGRVPRHAATARRVVDGREPSRTRPWSRSVRRRSRARPARLQGAPRRAEGSLGRRAGACLRRPRTARRTTRHALAARAEREGGLGRDHAGARGSSPRSAATRRPCDVDTSGKDGNAYLVLRVPRGASRTRCAASARSARSSARTSRSRICRRRIDTTDRMIDRLQQAARRAARPAADRGAEAPQVDALVARIETASSAARAATVRAARLRDGGAPARRRRPAAGRRGGGRRPAARPRRRVPLDRDRRDLRARARRAGARCSRHSAGCSPAASAGGARSDSSADLELASS